MAFLRASIFNSTSFPSRASLISLARAGVPLSKWTRRVHDFSIIRDPNRNWISGNGKCQI